MLHRGHTWVGGINARQCTLTRASAAPLRCSPPRSSTLQKIPRCVLARARGVGGARGARGLCRRCRVAAPAPLPLLCARLLALGRAQGVPAERVLKVLEIMTECVGPLGLAGGQEARRCRGALVAPLLAPRSAREPPQAAAPMGRPSRQCLGLGWRGQARKVSLTLWTCVGRCWT